MNVADHFQELHSADTVLTRRLRSALQEQGMGALVDHEQAITEALLRVMGQGCHLGDKIVSGCLFLVRRNSSQIPAYLREITCAGEAGETICGLLSPSLAAVMSQGSARLTDRFLEVVATMSAIGTYTLKNPLAVLVELLAADDIPSAASFLELLAIAFGRKITYGVAQQFSHVVPRTVLQFPPEKRKFQTDVLGEVARVDQLLVIPFLDGLSEGLNLLPERALKTFVSEGLGATAGNPAAGRKYLSLASRMAVDRLEELNVAVPLAGLLPVLTRYLRARTGRALSIRPLSGLKEAIGNAVTVRSDAVTIYVPDEISVSSRRAGNVDLYKLLVRLEAGHHEFGTYEFDLEKLSRRHGAVFEDFRNSGEHPHPSDKSIQQSDLERFFQGFTIRRLAKDLFTVFEHGRIRMLTAVRYPGLAKRMYPKLIAESTRENSWSANIDPIQQLYLLVGLGMTEEANVFSQSPPGETVLATKERFVERIRQDSRVESAAALVCETFPQMLAMATGDRYTALATPFGRVLHPDFYHDSMDRFNRLAEGIRRKLADMGVPAYRADIRKKLIRMDGSLSLGDIRKMAVSYGKDDNTDDLSQKSIVIDLARFDINTLFGRSRDDAAPVVAEDGEIFWYQEWDSTVGDYMNDHVRVLDKSAPEIDNAFYAKTLDRRAGLVKKIRYSFELIKPEGLSILRQWVEGDEFDYRALIDFAMDRRMRRVPSDRIYIKRIKQTRDVAALLLVDQSRSTANQVYGSEARVLDVEKEAIVLFCEALETVGDSYAVAGFSGTGRLGVDYRRVKDFNQLLDNGVKCRIGGMRPMRSTRMGAAIRHATACFDGVDNKVRILIIVGDGFPNDLNYKQTYAVEDTRRAISEARAKGIVTHAITVDLAGDQRLDDIYGSLHHNVISNVADLPDKLMQIYGKLTRS